MIVKPPGHIIARQPWDTGHSSGDDPYTELAVAVVLQAVEDYIKVLKKLIKDEFKNDIERQNCNIEKEQLEYFFHSQDYEFYTAFITTEIEPETLIYHCGLRAKEQLEEERKKEEERARKQAENEAQKESKIENNTEINNEADKAESEET